MLVVWKVKGYSHYAGCTISEKTSHYVGCTVSEKTSHCADCVQSTVKLLITVLAVLAGIGST